MAKLIDVVGGRVAPKDRLGVLRSDLGVGTQLRAVRARPMPFRVLFQNTALITPDLAYKGASRAGNLGALIKHLRGSDADVIGLCEVFSENEQNEIIASLRGVYPHSVRGPGGAVQGSGLLLLSRHVPKRTDGFVYRQGAGIDDMAAKGALHARLDVSGSLVDVFITHTQDIEVLDGESALSWQLQQLGHFVQSRSAPTRPSFAMGDLNWPAARRGFKKNVLGRMGGPIDLWTAANPGAAGATFVTPNSFYASPVRAKAADRLDYILQPSRGLVLPVAKAVEITRFENADKHVSDHFGLCASFDQALMLSPDRRKPLRTVVVELDDMVCFRNTAGTGLDEVSFTLQLKAGRQHSKLRRSKKIQRVREPLRPAPVRGVPRPRPYPAVRSRRITIPTALVRDPKGPVVIEVTGTEHDTLSADDNLGTVRLTLSQAELQLYRGQTVRRALPMLTGDGGLFAVTAKITSS